MFLRSVENIFPQAERITNDDNDFVENSEAVVISEQTTRSWSL